MQTITTDSSQFLGRTSRPPWRAPHDPLTCRGCGSSLAGRREAVRRDTSKGIAFIVETFQVPLQPAASHQAGGRHHELATKGGETTAPSGDNKAQVPG
jgi:hypothetical protein